jgi:hypothetical protein
MRLLTELTAGTGTVLELERGCDYGVLLKIEGVVDVSGR